jgi:hypothetical protein
MVKWSDVEQLKEQLEHQNYEEKNYEDDDDDYNDEEDDDDYDYDEDEDEEFYEENDNESIKIKNNDQVCTKVINIKHTKSIELDDKQRNQKVSRDKPSLDTPGDIWSMYHKPKSILKSKNNFEQNAQQVTSIVSDDIYPGGGDTVIKNMNLFNQQDESCSSSHQKENQFKFEPLKVKEIIFKSKIKNNNI